jgi:FixJ family two-component response regulator
MARETMPKLVAIVEDDESYRLAVQRLLKSAGFSVQSFSWAEEFLDSGCQRETGLIADIRMPGMSSLDLQTRLNADHCGIPIIFVTAHGDEKMRLQAMRGGAVKFPSSQSTIMSYGGTESLRRSLRLIAGGELRNASGQRAS